MPPKRTIPRACRHCSRSFLAVVSEVNAGNAHYCSRACAASGPRTVPVYSEDGLTAHIPLRARDGSIRAYAIVDAADADWVNQWHWCLDNGYARRSQKADGRNQAILLHRELLGLTPFDNREGDHLDLDRLNNRRSNLRVLPYDGRPNTQNKRSYRGSTSAHRGVSWSTRYGQWVAQIQINGKGQFLGRFDDELEAAEVARAARARLMPYATD